MSKQAQKHQPFRSRIVRHGEMPANQFLANPLNARRHPAPQRDAMRGILDEIGFVQGVIVSAKSGVLLDGHLRVEEALSRDENQPIPFVEVDLSPDEERLVLSSFDPLTELATYDKEVLDALLHEVSTGDAAVSEMLSKLAEDNGLYFGEEKRTEEVDAAELVDRAAELQKKWKVKRGQVWQIGRHRLICGDSTNAGDVAELMGGARAQMIFTDPPYGINYEGKTAAAMTIQNDGDSTCAVAGLRVAAEFLEAGGACYVCFPAEELAALAEIWRAPLRLQSLLLWAKDTMVMGRKDYHYQHEPIWYGWKEGAAHRWFGGRDQVTLWRIDRPTENAEHPTSKPAELADRALLNSSLKDDVVLDVFGGSGSTMSAAERKGRTALLSDIDPNYCAVTLERMSLLGLTPELSDG